MLNKLIRLGILFYATRPAAKSKVLIIDQAGVAELADARDLKSSRKKKGLFPLSPAVPATY